MCFFPSTESEEDDYHSKSVKCRVVQVDNSGVNDSELRQDPEAVLDEISDSEIEPDLPSDQFAYDIDQPDSPSIVSPTTTIQLPLSEKLPSESECGNTDDDNVLQSTTIADPKSGTKPPKSPSVSQTSVVVYLSSILITLKLSLS